MCHGRRWWLALRSQGKRGVLQCTGRLAFLGITFFCLVCGSRIATTRCASPLPLTAVACVVVCSIYRSPAHAGCKLRTETQNKPRQELSCCTVVFSSPSKPDLVYPAD